MVLPHLLDLPECFIYNRTICRRSHNVSIHPVDRSPRQRPMESGQRFLRVLRAYEPALLLLLILLAGLRLLNFSIS